MTISFHKKGFTLIELIVTIGISGIFFTMAMHMFYSANSIFANNKKIHEYYFEYNVKKAKAEKMLRNNPGICSNGSFLFIGDAADSLNNEFPFPAPKCTKIDRKRSLVYVLGKMDSTNNGTWGFSANK